MASPLERLVAIAEDPDTPLETRVSCHAEVAPYLVPKYRPTEAIPNSISRLSGSLRKSEAAPPVKVWTDWQNVLHPPDKGLTLNEKLSLYK